MTQRHYPTPTASDLRALAELERPVVSVMVPVTAAVPDAAQNAVRHARVVKQALERLRALGADRAQVERAERDLAEFGAEDRSPTPGVAARAAYWSPGSGCRVFGLPFPIDETARVGSCAVVRPLVRALQRPSRYRVLLLSANEVALFEGDEHGLTRVHAAPLPTSLEDALGAEVTEQALQYHSSYAGGRSPVYHGQGGAPDERKVDVERLHQRVARGLEAVVDGDVVPLVLAADVQHRPGLLRALHRDVGLVEASLEGNFEHASITELHERAWPLVVESVEAKVRKQTPEAAQPRVARLAEVVANASMGRIRRLWVPAGGEVPAQLDTSRASASEAWGDDDLIESLAVEVLRRGGSVQVLSDEWEDGPSSVAAELW